MAYTMMASLDPSSSPPGTMTVMVNQVALSLVSKIGVFALHLLDHNDREDVCGVAWGGQLLVSQTSCCGCR